MNTEGQVAAPPSRGKLLAMLGGGIVVASLLVVLFLLPAEFHTDPTGFGKLTGLSDLAGPKEVEVAAPAGTSQTARFYPSGHRSDVVEIKMPPGLEDGSELEYKIKMKEGATLVYSWTVENLDVPDDFYVDFHSQSDPTPDVKVTSHQKGTSIVRADGALVAPFTGIHGWYLQNSSVKPVVFRVKLAGFYELQPEQDSIPIPENIKVTSQN